MGSGDQTVGVEDLVVEGGDCAALPVPAGEMAEFDLEDGGLHGVQSGVPPDLVVEVAPAHAVRAQRSAVVVEICR